MRRLRRQLGHRGFRLYTRVERKEFGTLDSNRWDDTRVRSTQVAIG